MLYFFILGFSVLFLAVTFILCSCAYRYTVLFCSGVMFIVVFDAWKSAPLFGVSCAIYIPEFGYASGQSVVVVLQIVVPFSLIV